jgi:hypothetical protein
MPFSPSMKVMALRHAPVLPKPGSRVMRPVVARSFWMSMALSPSLPVMTGRVTGLPLWVSVAAVSTAGKVWVLM